MQYSPIILILHNLAIKKILTTQYQIASKTEDSYLIITNLLTNLPSICDIDMIWIDNSLTYIISQLKRFVNKKYNLLFGRLY
jgi:hypothetical protein